MRETLPLFASLLCGSNREQPIPGAIAAFQAVRDWVNFRPRLHFLATEGGVDEQGIFHKVPPLGDSRLAEILAWKALEFLGGRELLSPANPCQGQLRQAPTTTQV